MDKKNVIAIYHCPQECGQPFVAFVSQASGEIIDSLDIPYGYYDSGWRCDTEYTKIDTWTRHIKGWGEEPKLEDMDTERMRWKEYNERYTFIPREVRNVTKDKKFVSFPPVWAADVDYDVCEEKMVGRYVPEEDEFKSGMEENGIAMTEWDCEKRRQTAMMDFLKAVLDGYKDYNVINVVEIG